MTSRWAPSVGSTFERLRPTTTTNLMIAIVSATLISELLLSWRLWFPVARTFPSIPAIERLPLSLTDGFPAALSVIVLCSLVAINLPKFRLASLCLLLAGLSLLILSDLARLQPWLFMQATVLSLLVGGAKSKTPVPEVVGWILLILATTYFWSGIQKVNVYFLTEVFSWLIEPFYGGDLFALTPQEWNFAKTGSLPTKFYVVLVVPTLECLTGILLLVRRSRRIGLALALSMHLFILIVLGPFGRSWNQVVWPWNVGMILLLLILIPIWRPSRPLFFWRARTPNAVLSGLILLFGVMPAFNFSGHWDYYLSGSLYAGTNSTAEYFYDSRFDDFSDPDSSKHIHSIADRNQDIVNLDMWAFSSMRTPLYPETRYFKALGRHLCSRTHRPDRAGLRITEKAKFTAIKTQTVYLCADLERS